ncbi:MAG: hypothetical protein JXR91_05590 [Deltaproteobacteria bacterium]|nr:hypothetical protein [Deltaproteobacteria bacterium]
MINILLNKKRSDIFTPGLIINFSMVVFTALMLIGIYRGYNVPFVYAKTHWFLTYDFGFIKRGLIGTLIKPILINKNPVQINAIMYTFSVLTEVFAFFSILWFSKKVISKNPADLYINLSLGAFFSSSAIVFFAHSNGLFDIILISVAIAAAWFAIKQQYILVAILSLLALMIHEMYFLFCFPAIIFILFLQFETTRKKKPEKTKSNFIKLVLTILPTILLMSYITVSHRHLPKEVIQNLDRQTASYKVLSGPAIGFATFHLTNTFSKNYDAQGKDSFVKRLTDIKIDRVTLPVTSLLLLITVLLLVKNRYYISLALLPFAVFAPLIIHLVAWDTSRFTNFTIFHAFLCYSAVSLLMDNRLGNKWLKLTIVIASLLAIFTNFYFEVPLMNEQLDWHGLFELNSK